MRLAEPPRAARAAGLRHLSDAGPGIRRVRKGKGFEYVDSSGRPVGRAERARIEAMAIPPAWERVWICPRRDGHLQATGYDVKGRKQYRYHAEWSSRRNRSKFDSLAAFGRALPAIRRRVERDLGRPGLPREKVLACIVRLMDQTLVRVGNDEYVRSNGSYGLTTVRDEHATINGDIVRFDFNGKSGRAHGVEVRSGRLAKIVRQCRDLPGEELFAYLGDDGSWCDVKSDDVNAYLLEVAGEPFTAKDFRTWGGTVIAAETLHWCGAPGRAGGAPLAERELKRREVAAVKAAAAALCNTPATCRKYYIHPDLIGAYADGRLGRAFAGARARPGMSRAERAVLALLGATAARTPGRTAGARARGGRR